MPVAASTANAILAGLRSAHLHVGVRFIASGNSPMRRWAEVRGPGEMCRRLVIIETDASESRPFCVGESRAGTIRISRNRVAHLPTRGAALPSAPPYLCTTARHASSRGSARHVASASPGWVNPRGYDRAKPTGELPLDHLCGPGACAHLRTAAFRQIGRSASPERWASIAGGGASRPAGTDSRVVYRVWYYRTSSTEKRRRDDGG
jgi:hypothetical protein